MTKFLASVRDIAEAERVLCAGADIVDIKDPANGALGAADTAIIRACVAHVGRRVPVSATAGDIPMEPDCVTGAVMATAACGVDDVKLGIGSDGDLRACLTALRDLDLDAGLILVFFADAMPDGDPFALAMAAGARGVMLDTAGKGAGALPDYMSLREIAAFVARGQRMGLMVGLAGALRAPHVASLLDCEPDVIGFRGALCGQERRQSGIDPVACGRIRALIPRHQNAPVAQISKSGASAVY